MVCIAVSKTVVSYVWLTVVINRSYTSVCVWFCTVIIAARGRILVSKDANMETYRHWTGSQFVIFK